MTDKILHKYRSSVMAMTAFQLHAAVEGVEKNLYKLIINENGVYHYYRHIDFDHKGGPFLEVYVDGELVGSEVNSKDPGLKLGGD